MSEFTYEWTKGLSADEIGVHPSELSLTTQRVTRGQGMLSKSIRNLEQHKVHKLFGDNRISTITIDDYREDDPQLDIDDSVTIHYIHGGVVFEIPISCVADSVFPGTEAWEVAKFNAATIYSDHAERHMLPTELLLEKSLINTGEKPKKAISSLVVCNQAFYPVGYNVRSRVILPTNYRYQEIAKSCSYINDCREERRNAARLMADNNIVFFDENEIDNMLIESRELNGNHAVEDMVANITTFARGIMALISGISLLRVSQGESKLPVNLQNFDRFAFSEKTYSKYIQNRHDIRIVIQGLMLASTAVFTHFLRRSGWPFLFRNSQTDWMVISDAIEGDLVTDRTIVTNPLRDFRHLVNQQIIYSLLQGEQSPPFSEAELQQFVE
ncbi:hypothetical protein A3A93_06125 [Candidatus Roizmanbacteria bacterium RIFCSPLOWO2_01_FULL_38_12]|uniref:RNB domain-containing protein n=1 Tax=Candidatus Roizmanbacteria bacterium RIFCSPLOWO2_01_FULL_38_12 TaxID=1802061 RepID=A0A1F7ITW9_9BACT|nr:MAG: hypothetical protein A3F59_01565 [Candidatus Roizmanbacteria bacterium RIFCSPHIGHO2_12_FULL_38_13]OGK46808.1 MAG: hypothetical protein A3A93_06125 [Candidatus Roizmanbacteria bacterium RIFCSPLOWO2_01_FULL_38_12]